MDEKTLTEWAQREAAYYADAEKWKHLQEKMKRDHAEHVAKWKRKDAELEKIIAQNKAQEEIKKYTQQEINEAIRQIRIDRLKIILEPYVP